MFKIFKSTKIDIEKKYLDVWVYVSESDAKNSHCFNLRLPQPLKLKFHSQHVGLIVDVPSIYSV